MKNVGIDWMRIAQNVLWFNLHHVHVLLEWHVGERKMRRGKKEKMKKKESSAQRKDERR